MWPFWLQHPCKSCGTQNHNLYPPTHTWVLPLRVFTRLRQTPREGLSSPIKAKLRLALILQNVGATLLSNTINREKGGLSPRLVCWVVGLRPSPDFLALSYKTRSVQPCCIFIALRIPFCDSSGGEPEVFMSDHSRPWPILSADLDPS